MFKRYIKYFIKLVLITAIASKVAHSAPPFWGTIFEDPDIITEADPTTYQNVVYTGQSDRFVFDRRVDDWITINAYLFDVTFNDGLAAEIQINPEFGTIDNALIEAKKYGKLIGQLPTSLRRDVQTVWIHKGTEPFGGGNNNLLIHTGQSDLYEADGILEEVFVHEAAHTSLDASHAQHSGWLAAQNTDNEFISIYARDNPQREDIAESFLLYFAAEYRRSRISASLLNTVMQTIPNRIDYFNNQQLNMFPIVQDNATLLLNNTWRLISLPADPGENKTVSDIFGDDLPIVDYGRTWEIFSYTSGGSYKSIGVNEQLALGVGYWMIQLTGEAVQIDLPDGSVQPSNTETLGCSGVANCYEIPIVSGNSNVWNLVGNPTNKVIVFDDIRAKTNGGECTSGCTLNEAENYNYLHNQMWRYADDGTYEVIESGDSLSPWEGVWYPALPASNTIEPKLLMPIN